MKDGYPLNWRVYMGGLSYLIRHNAREDLRMFSAVAYGTTGGQKAADWANAQSTLAGW